VQAAAFPAGFAAFALFSRAATKYFISKSNWKNIFPKSPYG
jgi:hypothetical protein